MAAGRPTVRERNRDRVRDEIGAAARRLFASQGYAATTIEQVAEEAGVSLRTVYRHFPRKEDLPFHRHAALTRALEEALDADDGTRPSLEVLVEAFWRALPIDVDESAEDFLLLLEREPELRRYEHALMSANHEVVVGYLRRRLDGEADADDRAELLAGAFLGTLMASRTNAGRRPDLPPRVHIDRAVELLRPLPWP